MSIPFDQISRATLAQAERLLPTWFPNGKKVGREFKVGNLRGDKGESLSVNLDTGCWADFATSQRGADLIDLRAASLGLPLKDVATELGKSLGIQNGNGHAAKQQGWEPIIPPPASAGRPDTILAQFDTVHEYTDTTDRVTHYVGRVEAKDGRRKQFVPITFGILNGVSGWHRKSPNAPRPLYGLNRLASIPDAPVIVCEGEKAADAAQRMFLDYACVAWPNGAEAVDRADFSPLKGRRVFIWPDNDEPGHKAAEALRAKLPHATCLRVTDLPSGHDAADVFVDEPEEWIAQRIPSTKSRILTSAAFLKTFVPPDYIIDGLVQRTRLYACTSKTGHGKTAVWLYLGCMVQNGRNIGNLETTKGAVVFLAGENPDDLCGRMHAAIQEYGLREDQAPHVLPLNFPMTTEEAEKLQAEIDALSINPVLIIVDTAAAFFPGEDDNANVPMGEYGRTLRILTRCKGNPAVVVLAHPVKNPDKENLLPRGGGAFLNELDGNLTLWSESLGESTTLHWQGKFRGPDFDAVPFILRAVKVPGLVDAKNRPLVSIVASVQSQEGAANAAKQRVHDEDTVLRALYETPGISMATIAEQAGWVNDFGLPLKAKVQRCLKRLKADGLAKTHRDKWVITPNGKTELLTNKNDDPANPIRKPIHFKTRQSSK